MSEAASRLDLRPDHWAIVRGVLQRHVPDRKVLAFGSRANWTAKEYSDLDLAILGDEPLFLDTTSALAEGLAESDLPFKVDLVDWARIDETFRDIIRRDGVAVQVPTEDSAANFPARQSPANCGKSGMPSEWSAIRLGDVCSKIGSGATPRGGKEVYLVQGSFSLIRSQNVHNDGFRAEGLVFIEERHAAKLAGVEILAGDVLLNITGDSVARACQVDPRVLPARVNQHVAIIRPEPDQLDPTFFRYVLVSPDMQARMYSLAGSGATRNALTKAMIEDFAVLAPKEITEQRAIAHILGTLDDKIELNRRMNETLEAMARALFKSWFVDFDPVRAKIEGRDPYLAPEIWDLFPDKLDDGRKPEGWAYRPVSAFSKIKGGKQLTKDNFVESGPHPVFGGAGIMGYTDRSNADGFVISVGRVGAYCGQFVSFRGKAWINNNASQISPFEAVSGEWLLLNLRALDIDLIKKGAAQPFVSNSDIAAMKIIDPGEKVLESFHEIIAPLAAVRENNDRENSILTSMRNLLLPGLMSGEVRIADADRIVKEFT